MAAMAAPAFDVLEIVPGNAATAAQAIAVLRAR
jgi:hypothetical protein